MASILDTLAPTLIAIGSGLGGLLGGAVGGYQVARKRRLAGPVNAPATRDLAACRDLQEQVRALQNLAQTLQGRMGHLEARAEGLDDLRAAQAQIQDQLRELVTTATETARIAAYLHGRMDATHVPAPAPPPAPRR